MVNRTNQANLVEQLQDQVSGTLVRHKSILDIMTKLDEYNARINRAVAKSVTSCGCIEIGAEKQDIVSETLSDALTKADSHIIGHVCPNCKEALEQEIGAYIYFLASLASTLDFSLSESVEKELNRTRTLGVYGMK